MGRKIAPWQRGDLRALDFKLLGSKGRPPWLQQEVAFTDVHYAPGCDEIRPRTEVSRMGPRADV